LRKLMLGWLNWLKKTSGSKPEDTFLSYLISTPTAPLQQLWITPESPITLGTMYNITGPDIARI
jgi:hypothetical protein